MHDDHYPGLDDVETRCDDDDYAAALHRLASDTDADPDPGAGPGPGPGNDAGSDPELDPGAAPVAPLFTVTNPPGTIAVSVFADGRVHRIDLAPSVAQLTEDELAQDILLIARLAAHDARSAQHAAALDAMNRQGHDSAATRDFLHRDLGLTCPEQAGARRADLFSARYGDPDE